MKTVTVAQALKLRKRLEEKLARYEAVVRDNNRVEEGLERPFDVADAWRQCEALAARLAALRAAVARANAKVTPLLIEFDILKRRRGFLANVPCAAAESGYARNGEPAFTRYAVCFGEQKMFELVEALDARLNAIQDELDAFNASEKVEVDE